MTSTVLEESIAAKKKYNAKYLGSNIKNKKLLSIVHENVSAKSKITNF